MFTLDSKRNKPLVSIILPTHNGEKYISRAIKSVLSQSYIDWELIIVIDGSIDETERIVKEASQKDERIKIIINQDNLKLPRTLNKGIGIANGKYIARIDDDDIWIDRDKILKQVTFLENNKNILLVGTKFQSITEDGNILTQASFSGNNNEIKKIILNENPFGHSTVVFSKNAFEKSGGYNTSLKYTEDWDLWLKIGKIGDVYILDQLSVKYLAKNNFRKGMSTSTTKLTKIIYDLRIIMLYWPYYRLNIFKFLRHLMYYILFG